MARVGRRRGRADPRGAEFRFARPSIRSGTPSRRLVSVGSLSVPRLQAGRSNPDRLRRGNRARARPDHERGNSPAGNRLGEPTGGALRRDGGHRRRRDGERAAQPICIFLKTVSNRDRCSDSAERGERPIPFPYNRADARHLRKAEVSPRGVYADDRVNAFIADQAHRDQIVAVPSDAQNLRNLLAGVIDGFLADRITAATTAWRRHEGARIEEHPLRFSTNIHFMLSRATQTPQMLARLNDAIDELRRSGELRRIADVYALPVLINQTLDSEWFRVLAFIGIVAFALSGVVLAYEGQYTLFGALVLAALPAVGGGIVRDLLLQRDPLGIVQNPEALLTVFATVLVGMVVIKTIPRLRASLLTKYLQSRAHLGTRLIEVFDAIALAAFTVVGVVVVLDTSAQPLWLWGRSRPSSPPRLAA